MALPGSMNHPSNFVTARGTCPGNPDARSATAPTLAAATTSEVSTQAALLRILWTGVVAERLPFAQGAVKHGVHANAIAVVHDVCGLSRAKDQASLRWRTHFSRSRNALQLKLLAGVDISIAVARRADGQDFGAVTVAGLEPKVGRRGVQDVAHSLTSHREPPCPGEACSLVFGLAAGLELPCGIELIKRPARFASVSRVAPYAHKLLRELLIECRC